MKLMITRELVSFSLELVQGINVNFLIFWKKRQDAVLKRRKMSNLVERLERLVQFLLDHIFFLLDVVELDFITLDSLDKLVVFFDEDVIGALQFHVCLAQMSDAILELQKALFTAKCVMSRARSTFSLFYFF